MNTIEISKAHGVYENIVTLRKSINTNFWLLVENLKVARENRHWAILGHESWSSYLAQPEIDLNLRTVDNYISIYNSIKDNHLLTPACVEIDISKLQTIAPYLHNGNAAELIEKARTLSRSDLRQELKEEKRKDEAILGKSLPDSKLVELINGDFTKTNIKENSVNLIITDPPYPGEYLPLWKELFIKAHDWLKPSGFLVAYSGELHLNDIFTIHNECSSLKYYWTFCLYHEGQTQLVMPRNVICRWKPILVFQKPPFKKLENVVQDYVISEQPEKSLHDWQQSESGVTSLIESFSKVGDTVLDPFMGSGTFPMVAHKLNRKAMGIEIDETSFLIAKKRIHDSSRTNK
jgi:16S rRNA G966 N2-methylase RsmD